MAKACAKALDDINLSGTRRQKEAKIAGRKLFLSSALEAAVKELEIDPRGKTDVEFKEEEALTRHYKEKVRLLIEFV